MVGQCLLIIACLIAGYLCGCYGRFLYDGTLVVHEGDNRIEVRTPLADEVFLQRRYLKLKVIVKEETI